MSKFRKISYREPVYKTNFIAAALIKTREELQVAQYDLAIAFDINRTTLQRMEAGMRSDKNTISYYKYILIFPMWLFGS